MQQKFGLDKAVIFTMLSKMVQGLGGVLSLLLVTQCLTKAEQGYYYTFASILALQVFFELGLMGIITQFVAHEAAHLSLNGNGNFEGNPYHLSRLAHIIRLGLHAFAVVSATMLLVLLYVGFVFFGYFNNQLNVSWDSPWLLLCIATMLLLMFDLLLAILEGLGKVQEVARVRFVQYSLNLCVVAMALLGGMKLYAGALALLVSISASFLLLVFKGHWQLIRKIYSLPITEKVDYKKEVLPYQFRIALSFLSGYFIFQILNPILFAFYGPVVAGKMGATLAVLNGILGISLSFMSTKVAFMSNYVARKEFLNLNTVYKKNMLLSAGFCLLGLLFFSVLIVWLNNYYPLLAERFLDFRTIMFLSLTQLASVIGSCQGYYLRSFKQEPFFIVSIAVGLLSGVVSYFSAKHTSITVMAFNFFLVNAVVGFVWGCFVFYKKKKQWTGSLNQ